MTHHARARPRLRTPRINWENFRTKKISEEFNEELSEEVNEELTRSYTIQAVTMGAKGTNRQVANP